MTIWSRAGGWWRKPRKNIALVRNKALEQARGDAIAFIDDDEYPVTDWLLRLRAACLQYQASGVLGPVLPYFEGTPPAWLIKAGFCDRPRHETGFQMPWTECRTGNVLLRREIFAGLAEVFRPQFGTGSEDVDFFRRMSESGRTFAWCDEAIAHEIVPPERWTRSFLLKRALLRGNDSLKHPTGRLKNILTALIAVPLYGLALPFLLLAGHLSGEAVRPFRPALRDSWLASGGRTGILTGGCSFHRPAEREFRPGRFCGVAGDLPDSGRCL